VVESDALQIRVIKLLFDSVNRDPARQFFYTYKVATSGKTALQTLAQESFHLVGTCSSTQLAAHLPHQVLPAGPGHDRVLTARSLGR